MKYLALCAATASATWGEWDSTNYCDFSQEEVDQEKITSDYYYSSDQCSYFCQITDQEDDTTPNGTDLCCDYEQWANGSYDCTLYKGGSTIANSFENDGSGDEFQSMTFTSGDYQYTLQEYIENVKESMIDEGCEPSCVDAALTATETDFEAVATACGCPTYMLRNQKAQGTLNLQDAPAAQEPAAEAPAAEEPAAEKPAAETPAAEEPVKRAKADPLVVFGGVATVFAILCTIVKCSKRLDDNEGGEFEK